MPFGIALLLTVAVIASFLPGAPADARLTLISVDAESDVASTDSATTSGTWGPGQDMDTGFIDQAATLANATSLDGEMLIGEVPLGASASWRSIEPRMLFSESDASLSAAGDFGVVIQADGRFTLPAAINPVVHDGRAHLIVHVVRRGESLQAIARQYHVSLMELVWSNGLTNIDRPAGGRRLRVPDTHGVVHIVKEHETLKYIAARVGVSVKRLMDYNDLKSANVVIGMVLIAPGGHGAALPTYKTPWHGVYAYSGALPKVYSGTTFRYPVPGGRYVRGFTRTHQGMDIAAAMGHPILAAAAGVVVRAGWMAGGCANTVFIAHGSNLFTGYCHQSRILVSVGQHVARGQIIGLVGSTGNSTGPHCHFLVSHGFPFSYNSTLYDPSRFLP
jgi:LysM repeat protein